MGKRGPAPEPTALKLLKGNPGKRPINQDEPQPRKSSGAPSCPRWMPKAGRKEWRRIVPELRRLGLLTMIDVATLEGYCNAYARAILADQDVAERGLTITTDKGFVLKNPAVGISQKSWEHVYRFGTQYGLTPSSRSGMHIKPPGQSSPTKAFLTGSRRKA